MQKSYISNFTVQIGLLGVPCEVVAARSTERGLKNVCPDCFQPLKQKSCCEEHGDIAYADMAKAKQTPQGLVPIPLDELEAAKDTSPKWLLDVSVATQDELLTLVQPSGSLYRLRPTKAGSPGGYGLLRELMKNHPELALYGMAKLQGNFEPKPFLLSLWRDQIVMKELVPLQEMAEPDELPVITTDPKYLAMLEQLIKATTGPVDPNVFLNKRRQAIEAFVSTHTDQAIAVDGGAQVAPITDIMAALEASLKNAKAQTPRRRAKKEVA